MLCVKNYIKKFVKTCNYDKEAVQSILSNFDKIKSNKNAYQKLLDSIKSYKNDFDYPMQKIIDASNEIASMVSIHEYESILVFLILLTSPLKYYYRKNGIQKSVWQNTVLDIKYKMVECKLVKNIYGIFVASWFERMLKLRIFGLGRLQFCPYNAERDYEKNGKKVNVGDKVLSIHIPRDETPLKPEDVDNSLKMAKEFFKKDFEGKPLSFICVSWMLYPDIIKILKPTSNIAAFASRFDVLFNIDLQGEDKFSDMWRIFDMDYTGNINDYKEDSSLRRNMKNHLLSNGKVGESYGTFIYE